MARAKTARAFVRQYCAEKHLLPEGEGKWLFITLKPSKIAVARAVLFDADLPITTTGDIRPLAISTFPKDLQ